jgi:hypothetical protein
MKKILFVLLATGILAFAGCEKEPIPAPAPAPDVNLSVDEAPQSLVDTLGTVVFDNPMTSEVTAFTEATILDYPLFLDYDPFTMVVSRTNKRIDSCVRGIETTKAEKELLNKSFLAKLECQKANKATISKIHREIESWAKTQKENYYKNWYLVERGKLEDSLKRGLLTQTQYKEKLAALEKTWSSKMTYLNGQVKEKIKASLERAEACGKIKDCEKIYLDKVLDILGKTRFKKWIECYKHNYKKK